MVRIGSKQNFLLGLTFGIFIFMPIHILKRDSSKIEREERFDHKDVETRAVAQQSTVCISEVPQKETEIDVKQLYLKSVENLQQERLAAMNKACKDSYKMCYRKVNFANTNNLYSKKYKFSVCEVQKCGSTSWLKAILVMEGVYNVTDYNTKGVMMGDKVMRAARLHTRYSSLRNIQAMQEAWNGALKIITVRHPFARLVSAYNDKMVPNSEGYTDYYGPISRIFNKNYRHLRHNVDDRNKTDDGSATFEDFLNGVIDQHNNPRDSHWNLYYHLCRPCTYPYNYVVKFETLQHDIEHLETVLNISNADKKVFFPQRIFKSSDEMVRQHFQQVSRELVDRVYEVYKADFEMFGYERPAWLCST